MLFHQKPPFFTPHSLGHVLPGPARVTCAVLLAGDKPHWCAHEDIAGRRLPLLQGVAITRPAHDPWIDSSDRSPVSVSDY
jgi:hypothetical protein